MPNGAGGGGGGGTIVGVSNSFTGPAQALEVMGEHAYAFSGLVTSVGTGSANTTTLSFTTGNFYLVGTFTYTGDEQNGTTQYTQLSLNGSVIYLQVWDHDGASTPLARPVDIIIPPYTVVLAQFGVNAETNTVTHLISGRIYRG